MRRLLKERSLSGVMAGLLAARVGYTSSLARVLHAARARRGRGADAPTADRAQLRHGSHDHRLDNGVSGSRADAVVDGADVPDRPVLVAAPRGAERPRSPVTGLSLLGGSAFRGWVAGSVTLFVQQWRAKGLL